MALTMGWYTRYRRCQHLDLTEPSLIRVTGKLIGRDCSVTPRKMTMHPPLVRGFAMKMCTT
jgi:hypothetical protein